MNNEDMVCYCSNVTKGQIVAALEQGAKTIDDIRKATGACTLGKCKEMSPRGTCCSPIIMDIIREYSREHQ